MHRKLFQISLLCSTLYAQSVPHITQLDSLQIDESNTSATPTRVYYKYFDNLPSEITLKLADNVDMSQFANKKIMVGYGVINPTGNNCRVFPASATGLSQDTTICLPWWRIERDYITSASPMQSTSAAIDMLPTPHPPITVKACKQYSDGKQYPGGKTTCTSYYDMLAGGTCYTNPTQGQCYVSTCTDNIKSKCTFVNMAQGNITTLPSATTADDSVVPSAQTTKVNLVTAQYNCPSGPLTSNVQCIDTQTVLMFPVDCQDGNTTTNGILDTSDYLYCDQSNTILDASNNIIGFNGTCKNGKQVTCSVNQFSGQQTVCTEPIYQNITETVPNQQVLTKSYTSHSVDALSGEPDIYSANPNCIRTNDVASARDQHIYVDIQANGQLDDDIYILSHKQGGSHTKIYCNMQHPNGAPNKIYDGDTLNCLQNNGSYSVDQKSIPIDPTDIVTFQQNTENESVTSAPFVLGRTHYSSTKVTLNGNTVTPEAFSSDFPYYPSYYGYLQTWENTTDTMTILFPFAGIYDLYFYSSDGNLVLQKEITPTDFNVIANTGYSQLMLGKDMTLSPKIPATSADTTDNWVEWGGGVFGGRDSKTGVSVSSPDDAYSQAHAITNIIVKDLILGTITPITMVYPIPYPNRIFISKLDVYEKRQYRCYSDFPAPSLNETVTTKYICNTDPVWMQYQQNNTTDLTSATFWSAQDLCSQNCRTQQQCTQNNGIYNCSTNGKAFNTLNNCQAECFIQNTCDTYNQSSCKTTQQDVSNPVSDYTGKSLFTMETVTSSCTDTKLQYVGCAKYETKTIAGDLNVSLGNVGVEELNPVGFEDALTQSNMMNFPEHIWSGWSGQCVIGMKMDSSYLSDPMTIASYAMMAYASYSQLTTGDSLYKTLSTKFSAWAQSTSTAVSSATQTTIDALNATTGGAVTTVGNAASSVADSVSNVYHTAESTISTVEQSVSDFATAVKTSIGLGASTAAPLAGECSQSLNVLIDGYASESNVLNSVYVDGTVINANSAIAEAQEISINASQAARAVVDNTNWWSKAIYSSTYVNITNGALVEFGIKTAMILSAPPPKSYDDAQAIIASMSGQSTTNDAALQYNMCMASIGMSLPNLVSFSFQDSNTTTEQLKEPWKNPIQMTPSQLASIASIYGELFVTTNYKMDASNPQFLNIIALTPNAYMIAGQTICAGSDTAAAMSQILNNQANTPSPNPGKSIGLSIGLAALSALCPIAGFPATVAVDLYTNMMVHIDTCSNGSDAISRSMIDYKTYTFNNFDQCHQVSSHCSAKMFWGECVQTTYNKCCYDSILTRIFAEGVKAQMDSGWDTCAGITINDLKDISFTPCSAGQDPHVNKCFPSSSFSQFQQSLFTQATKNLQGDDTSLQSVVNQAKNAMVIPH